MALQRSSPERHLRRQLNRRIWSRYDPRTNVISYDNVLKYSNPNDHQELRIDLAVRNAGAAQADSAL
jgi:hypothetical protein